MTPQNRDRIKHQGYGPLAATNLVADGEGRATDEDVEGMNADF